MRYFLECSYKGSRYAGFQKQINANTIQAEVERALQVVLKQAVILTGSSRTDAGVHAFQNFFHFDVDQALDSRIIYNINALLPYDIVAKKLINVPPGAHARFNATQREYRYIITAFKDPFLHEMAWFYPYKVDFEVLQQAAEILVQYTDFTSFSKRNTQVKTKECTIYKSYWTIQNETLVYNVSANRFLRGMVRGFVGTMLLAGRKKISLANFHEIILSADCTRANFASPAHGLFLVAVKFPPPIFI